MRGSERTWTRREWIQATAAGAMTAAAGSGLWAAGGKRPLGVQVYTVRNLLKDQGPATFKAIAALGYKEVEILHAGMAEQAAQAKAAGLAPVSLHIESPNVTGDWTPWMPALKGAGITTPPPTDFGKLANDAKALGVRYLVVAYLMPNERSQPGFLDRFADAMNKAGETARQAGLQLCYHNHGFEFEKGSDGKTVLDTLMARFDPARVKLEMDVFWVALAGADPVALLQKYTGRVALVHLKDKAAGVPAETNEAKVAPTTFKEVGSGSLDFRAVLKAGDAAGVEHYFVEQDQTPGDPVASLKKSYDYLQQLA
jgi:sugar phosphate isomerase/epimerase